MGERRTVRDMTILELRERVEEAEKLLRVARQLAGDELRDPESADRARDRIASICREVHGLFPGLGELEPGSGAVAGEVDPPPEGHAAADGEDAHEADVGDDEDGEDEIDYDKLRAALSNSVLMDKIPEEHRPKFRAMAEQLLEAHDRHELYARVTASFAELERTTREGADEIRRQLALVLTFEELKSKSKG